MDFEFNLDEIELDKSEDLNLDNNFVFDQFGGSDNEVKPLPGEELLNDPEDNINSNSETNLNNLSENSENIEVELVGANEINENNSNLNNSNLNTNNLDNSEASVGAKENENNSNTQNTLNNSNSLDEENKPNNEVNQSDLKEPSINFQELIKTAQNGEVSSKQTGDILNSELEKGQPITGPVIVESDELDESAGEPKMDTVETYLKKIKATLDEEIDSVEVEGLEDILSNNKMNSPEYQKYLKILKKYFSEMKSKKKTNYEFSRGKDGSYIKKNNETGEEIIIKPPNYANIKNTIISNKQTINQLLFRLDVIKREMIAGDYKVHGKLSGEYDEKMSKLRDALKINREYSELISAVENTDKLILTNENIANMKINQVNNYSRVKELINKKGDMGEKVDEIINYLNVNNNILKNYEKTRKYNNVFESDYLVAENLPSDTKKKGTLDSDNLDEDLVEDEAKTDLSKINFKSPNYDLDLNALEEEEPKKLQNKEKIEKKDSRKTDFYSMFTKGEIKNPDELLEEVPKKVEKTEANEALGAVNIDELELGDDLEELQPEYADMPVDDEEEEDLDYRFNDKSKLTPEKQKEMEMAKAQDQAVPIDLENEGNPTKENNPPEEVEEANPKGKISKKELQKISRQLNKPVNDENIKVIEIDGDLSFKPKKCDDSKTKRSSVKTTSKNKDGKVRKRKGMDPELKNCMFPFKFKKKYHNECFDDGDGPICATERKENCALDKYAYCEN